MLPFPTIDDICPPQPLNVGLIVGGAVGGLFVVVLAVLVTVAIICGALWIRKRQEWTYVVRDPKKVFLTQPILNLHASYAVYPHGHAIYHTHCTCNPVHNMYMHTPHVHA